MGGQDQGDPVFGLNLFHQENSDPEHCHGNGDSTGPEISHCISHDTSKASQDFYRRPENDHRRNTGVGTGGIILA